MTNSSLPDTIVAQSGTPPLTERANNQQGGQTIAPSDVDFVPPFVKSLVELFRLGGKSISPSFILAGIGSEVPTPAACLRAAKTAGLEAKIIHREQLSAISPLVLPCVLLLTEDRSCVLVGLDGKHAEVIFPEIGQHSISVEARDLQAEYTGYAVFAQIAASLDKRASSIKLVSTKRWFWDVLAFYLPIYSHVAMASIIVNILAIASPLFAMNVYDRVVPNNATDTLWVLAAGVGLAYFFDFLLKTLRSHFVDVAGKNADIVLASKLVDKVLHLRLDAKPDSTGALVNNLREFESLREFFSSSSLLTLIDLPFLVIFLLLVGYIGGPIVFLPLGALPIMILFGFIMQFPGQRLAEQGYKEGMQKNALLTEMVSGLETIKCSMAESRMLNVWEKVVGTNARSSAKAKRVSNLVINSSVLITNLVSVVLIIWGVYLIKEGQLTMGALIGCNILVSRSMAPIMQLSTMLNRMQQSRMALKALDAIMQLPSEREDKPYVNYEELEASFSTENLVFNYPQAERPSLNNVSIHIKAGERVGILGAMGSGKTTLSRMLAGLYQPTEGAVKFGGVDLRQMDITELRSRIGFLPQDNFLFYGTIRDNIALGAPHLNDKLILRAAWLAGVTDFARAHPAGFGMQVGERGMSLSGGQRQSVALARAFLRDPDVLILDEPTSNMDTVSENLFKQRLRRVLPGKTFILVTHRLSLVDLVDRLIVLGGGQVQLDGPRDQVLAKLGFIQRPKNAPPSQPQAQTQQQPENTSPAAEQA